MINFNRGNLTTTGTLIRYYRKKSRLTQVSLGKKLDKGQSYISEVESGSLIPSMKAIRNLAMEFSEDEEEYKEIATSIVLSILFSERPTLENKDK